VREGREEFVLAPVGVAQRIEVAPHIVLAPACAQCRADDGKERPRAQRPFEQRDVAQGADRRAHVGGVLAAQREENQRKVGPRRLRGELRRDEELVRLVQGFLRDEDHAGAAIDLLDEAVAALANVILEAGFLQDVSDEARVPSGRRAQDDPALEPLGIEGGSRHEGAFK
jgi:hypothetical protein